MCPCTLQPHPHCHAPSIIRSIHLSASPAHRLNRPSLIRNDRSMKSNSPRSGPHAPLLTLRPQTSTSATSPPRRTASPSPLPAPRASAPRPSSTRASTWVGWFVSWTWACCLGRTLCVVPFAWCPFRCPLSLTVLSISAGTVPLRGHGMRCGSGGTAVAIPMTFTYHSSLITHHLPFPASSPRRAPSNSPYTPSRSPHAPPRSCHDF